MKNYCVISYAIHIDRPMMLLQFSSLLQVFSFSNYRSQELSKPEASPWRLTDLKALVTMAKSSLSSDSQSIMAFHGTSPM